MYMNHCFRSLCIRNMYMTVTKNDRYVQLFIIRQMNM